MSTHLLQLDKLFALLGGATELLDHLQGGVLVQASQAVAKVEQVNPAFALKVVDVEGELGTWIG